MPRAISNDRADWPSNATLRLKGKRHGIAISK